MCDTQRKGACVQTVGRLGSENFRRNRDRLGHPRSPKPVTAILVKSVEQQGARRLNVQSGRCKQSDKGCEHRHGKKPALKRCGARDPWARRNVGLLGGRLPVISREVRRKPEATGLLGSTSIGTHQSAKAFSRAPGVLTFEHRA